MARNDPYWMNARRSGPCGGKNCTDQVKPGDRIFFYPLGRTALVGPCADVAAADFRSAVADERM